MSERTEDVPERRDFLASAAFWTTVGTLAFAALGIARMPKPGVFPGASSLLKIGPPGEFPVSTEPMRVPGQNLYVIHDESGYGVMGGLCTHLGCVVAATPDGFDCPCHGSKFSREGKVQQGPAPSPLAWFEISLGPDGQIVVDTKKTVPVGTKFPLT